MLNSEPLVPFGLAIIAITALLIVVPYLRGKSDILTAWNLFLLGGAIFMGVGCLEVAYGIWHWPELQWFQPTKEDVQTYMLGMCVFYASLLVSYYWLTIPQKFCRLFLNKWPPMSTGVCFFVLVICGVIVVASLVTRGLFFVGPFLFNASQKAVLFATVFSFCLWYRNKLNAPLFVLFFCILACASVYSMIVFVGRRLLLSVLLAPLISMYWLKWRYGSPKTNVIRLAVVAWIALSLAAFYSSFRHFSGTKHSETDERTVSTVVSALKTTSVSGAVSQVSDNILHYFAQYCSHFSLLTIHMVRSGEIPIDPLNSLEYLLVYPIPRTAWEGKPETMGIRIVTEFLRLPYPTNWGLGVVANGYQEGGYSVIALYAFLAVVLVRLIDDALVRQPSNWFLIAMLCAAAPHFPTWIRGEPCVMTTEIGEAIVFAWALGLAARFLFGKVRANADTSRRPVSYLPPHGQLSQVRN